MSRFGPVGQKAIVWADCDHDLHLMASPGLSAFHLGTINEIINGIGHINEMRDIVYVVFKQHEAVNTRLVLYISMWSLKQQNVSIRTKENEAESLHVNQLTNFTIFVEDVINLIS